MGEPIEPAQNPPALPDVAPFRPTEAQRIRQMQASQIPVVADLIRRYPGTISLGQGVASYGPPPSARARLEAFWADPDNHRYQSVDGILPLRQALQTKLQSENAIPCGSDTRIVVTAGSNMGFLNAVLAISDPGDEIVLLTPFYFNHEMAVVLAGCRVRPVPTGADYQPCLDAIARAITPRTRAVLTVSPNNPTGAVYPETTLRAINALCRDAGIFHITDEAYEYFTYDGARHFSPASLPDAAGHTLSLFTLSKAYGFAGWRIGYMVIPAALFPAIDKIQETNLICPPIVTQHAALGALEAGAGYCHRFLPGLARARAAARETFASLEDLCETPQADGAFYFFLRIHRSHARTRARAAITDMELVERLIREHGVAVMPGSTFGVREGCALRVSYGALTPERTAEALGRLAAGLRAILVGHLTCSSV